MPGLTALMVLQHALFAANPSPYHAALQDAQAQRRPLLVLVGAQWCPGCQTMKHSVLPGLAKRGALKSVTYTTVDYDADAAIARQLMRVGSIPQLIAFSPTPDGKWRREQIIGEASAAQVQSLIARAQKAQQPPAETTASATGD